jgi:hypothetical protein
MFSDDRDVVRLVARIMPLVASFQVHDPDFLHTSSIHSPLIDPPNSWKFLELKMNTPSELLAPAQPSQVADGLANSCGGVLRGQGRQHLGAAFNLVAYYVLALPLGLALAFKVGMGTCRSALFWFICGTSDDVFFFTYYINLFGQNHDARTGLSGLWVGQVVALFLVGIGEYVAVWRFTDWDEEVRRGVARVSV